MIDPSSLVERWQLIVFFAESGLLSIENEMH
jgi:hypothetical protein